MRCDQCVYYSALGDKSGECRESPPRVFPVPVRTLEGQGLGFQPVFPQVAAECWCGAFSDGVEELIEGNAILEH